ncbi:uncharacterized protein LOC122366227 isoform X1 [Amphibalanus amphitrite]|nr:uncharacterized protein LOC122366227 isoform X1 [Amphibalanus amphitrite]XP_043194154.1 uncharacterized protein LOC122366227 isoform X1 [Amphibalanus amphitrite]
MARVLRNFRYRNFEEPVFPENIRYLSLLDSIISLDDEFYKFPDSSVPSLQTLCIKWMLRRSSVLFGPYSSSSTDQLLSSLPPGPFDSLPPPLCDLVCDLMLSLREPETSSAPLYCVISPYTRCLCLREPLTQVAAADLEGLLEARVCHLTELTWTSPPMSQRLLDHLIGLASLTTLITEEAVEPANVCRLLQQCSSLRVLKLQEAGCVAALAEQGVTSRRMVDLALLMGHDACLDLAALCRVFPALEKLSVHPDKPRSGWRVREAESELLEADSWFSELKELSLRVCENCTMLQRPLKALTKLSMESCKYYLEDVANQSHLNVLRSVQCAVYFRGSRLGSQSVVNIETLHVTTISERLEANLPLSGRMFPRLRRIALAGDVRTQSPGADFLALREFHYCYTSSVLAEKVLASAPLSQLEKLSLKYQFDDGAPLTLGTLSRCSRLSELELEGFSDVSVPSGLQLPSVRLLRLRGGTCWPRVVHWLLAALPGLKCLQLVELMIRSDLWTRWFRDWRQAGIEVELVGGCSIPPWRRSSIRSHAAAL